MPSIPKPWECKTLAEPPPISPRTKISFRMCLFLWKEFGAMSKTQSCCVCNGKASFFLRSFFCSTLLACHVGRGRSPSVSEVGEKTDLPTFHNIAKQNTQIKQVHGDFWRKLAFLTSSLMNGSPATIVQPLMACHLRSARSPWRNTSKLEGSSTGMICGFGRPPHLVRKGG